MEKKSKNKSENGNYGHGFSGGRGKHGGGGGDVGTSNESEWSINQNKKRQRRSTGGTFDVHDKTLSKNDFKQLSTDDKLVTLFEMLTFANSMNARVQNIEAHVQSISYDNSKTNERVKILEYRSIDAEARSRRNNLIFRGIPELLKSENCIDLVKRFICVDLDIDTSSIYIQRAHRLGAPNRDKSRPIIACFRDHQDVENILSFAHKLKGKPELGINRDYPNEIVEARSRIWPKFKEMKAANPPRTVHIGYPAKLIVQKKVVIDEFPDWREVLQTSRLKHKQTDPNKHGNITTPNSSELPSQNRFGCLMETGSASSESDSQTPDIETEEEVDQYSQVMRDYENRKKKQYVSSINFSPTPPNDKPPTPQSDKPPEIATT